jgi:hypothetical protein
MKTTLRLSLVVTYDGPKRERPDLRHSLNDAAEHLYDNGMLCYAGDSTVARLDFQVTDLTNDL